MRILATLCCSVVLSAPGVCAGDPLDTKVVITTLPAIRSTPESYKGVWVSFSIQFAAIGRLQNPFFTEFIASDFANFHGWADEQPIWRQADYDDVFGLLFISKENPQLDELFTLQPYDRLQVTGFVRNTFQGQPWLEIKSFTKQSDRVNTATLTHLYRGEEYMRRRQWTQAISELSLAPADGVPGHVRAMVHKNLGVCHLRIGEPGQALTQLTAAKELLTNDQELARLIQTASAAPNQALDREVRQQIRDSARPLWEAFDEGVAQPPKPQPAK